MPDEPDQPVMMLEAERVRYPEAVLRQLRETVSCANNSAMADKPISKADGLRAMREANYAANHSRGGVEGHTEHASRSKWGGGPAQVKTASAVSVPAKAGRARDGGGANPPARKRAQGSAPSVRPLQAGVEPGPRGTKLKRGRPKVAGPRPWEVAGISRRSWYRQQKEQRK